MRTANYELRTGVQLVIILMGVMGSGKTTIGQALAQALDCSFHDADAYHPETSRRKMGRGEPLTDEDRKPWLEALAGKIKEWNGQASLTVLACSALKQSYRDLLSKGAEVRWVYLKGPIESIRERLNQREGHFADSGLLQSQFAVLEEPKDALVVDIREDRARIVELLARQLKGN